ncbi:hypothetical protein N665_0393s0006 [Sinapis alba]|nr:hypothetical protein N665_0393s0006 [Sinapis alba]
MANHRDNEREIILKHFSFASGTLPVRYLGLPLMTKQIQNKLLNARFLSFAGRVQLIGSVIHSLINFWISAFRLPKKCIQEIDGLCAAFLWFGPALNAKKAKVAWKHCCKPRDEGGLGLKSIAEANKILQGIFQNLKFKMAKQHFFWFDTWTSYGRILDITCIRGCIDMGISLDATVDTVVRTHRRRRHIVDMLNNIENPIQNIKERGLTMRADVKLWRRGEDNYKPKFSSKETWKLTRAPQPKVLWSAGIWFNFNTPKYSFIAWLATLDRLTTGERTQRWITQHSNSCVFCNDPLESRDHLFFTCKFSEEVWKGLTQNLLATHYTSLDWWTRTSETGYPPFMARRMREV